MSVNTHGLTWRKSSRSSLNGCVEVAVSSDAILVRDSKMNPIGPVLRYTPHEWALFIWAVKNGEFDNTLTSG